MRQDIYPATFRKISPGRGIRAGTRKRTLEWRIKDSARGTPRAKKGNLCLAVAILPLSLLLQVSNSEDNPAFEITLIVLTILSIALAASLWRLYSANKKINARLSEMNSLLQQQFSFLQLLIDSIPNPVFVKDVELNYIICNNAFAKFTGRTKEELQGRTAFDFAERETAFMTQKMDIEVLSMNEVMKYEAKVKDADGNLRDMIFYKTRFREGNGLIGGIIGVMLDITDRKQAEESIVQSERTLRELNEAKDRYLNIINNEISGAMKYLITTLPPEITLGPVRAQWLFIPSSQLGGDSFGYHWIDEDNFAIYLLDVSGHGIGASLHSITIMNILKLGNVGNIGTINPKEPARVLEYLNQNFSMEEHNNLFFTIWYGVYNKKTRLLRFAGGGHHPALLFDRDGGVSRLTTPNCLIGAFSEAMFVEGETTVEFGSTMYIFSDGAFEIFQPDGRLWGFDELCNFITRERIYENGNIARIYVKAIEISTESGLRDDFSLLEISFDRDNVFSLKAMPLQSN